MKTKTLERRCLLRSAKYDGNSGLRRAEEASPEKVSGAQTESIGGGMRENEDLLVFTPPYSKIVNQRQEYFVSNSLRNGFQ
jgi:hypothetical protein